ncbi:MAG TPA: alpha-E domain-containing protein [Actinomycetota bacterium]|nr:alpha-E domain-containing protein [Actinomycetota bacterium]
MLSRVADSIYWLSRYTERAENMARFIDVNLRLALDLPPGTGEQWEPLVLITADLPLFNEHYDVPSRANIIEFLSFDEDNPNSICRCLAAARDNARSVREAISSEMWEQINRFYHLSRTTQFRGLVHSDPYTFFSRIRQESLLFAGVVDATMSHDEGWHFARLGRQLERADKTSRMLDVKYFLLLPTVSDVGTPLDDLQWSALLRSASALEAFRKRYGRISPKRVAEFLILDRYFPRSIRHCLLAAQDSLRTLSGSAVGNFSNGAEQRLGRLAAGFNYAAVSEIIAAGLHQFLDNFQRDLNEVGESIYATFFARRPEGGPSGRPAQIQIAAAQSQA